MFGSLISYPYPCSSNTRGGGARALPKFSMGDQKRRLAALLAPTPCDQCDYEAYGRSTKRKTARKDLEQLDRKRRIEHAGKLCACLSCAPTITRVCLINSPDCLCKNSRDMIAKNVRDRQCIHALCADQTWDCKTQSWDYGPSTPPPPPTPSMLALQKWRFSLPAEDLPSASYKGASRTRSRSRSPRRTAVSVASSSTYDRADAPQKDWGAVSELLTPQVLGLERTISEVRWALEDTNTTIRLTAKQDPIRHAVNVVRDLPDHMRFKVGITYQLENRFYNVPYAYSMPSSHVQDGVVYEGWKLVYVHHIRQVIGMLEHALIKIFKVYGVPGIAKERCANRLEIFDNNMDCEQSDEERSDAVGPHWVYITFGVRCHAIRP